MWSRARRLPADASTVPLHLVTNDRSATERRRADSAEATIDEAALRARVEAVEREAFTKGYAHGEREGHSAAAQKADVMLGRLSATIDEIAAMRAGLLHKTERDVVRLAVAMAERILQRALTEDPELLLAMARVAVDRLGENIVATLHLHPEDHRVLSAIRNQQPQAVPPAVSLEADNTVPRGGCLVRSTFGVVDLGLSAQMAELSRAVLGDPSSIQG